MEPKPTAEEGRMDRHTGFIVLLFIVAILFDGSQLLAQYRFHLIKDRCAATYNMHDTLPTNLTANEEWHIWSSDDEASTSTLKARVTELRTELDKTNDLVNRLEQFVGCVANPL